MSVLWQEQQCGAGIGAVRDSMDRRLRRRGSAGSAMPPPEVSEMVFRQDRSPEVLRRQLSPARRRARGLVQREAAALRMKKYRRQELERNARRANSTKGKCTWGFSNVAASTGITFCMTGQHIQRSTKQGNPRDCSADRGGLSHGASEGRSWDHRTEKDSGFQNCNGRFSEVGNAGSSNGSEHWRSGIATAVSRSSASLEISNSIRSRQKRWSATRPHARRSTRRCGVRTKKAYPDQTAAPPGNGQS